MEIKYRVTDGDKLTLFPYCEIHNWYYTGLPPLTHGCKECWMTFLFTQQAMLPKERKAENLDNLEEVMHHVVEAVERGEWDFKPTLKTDFSVEKDVSDADVKRELSKNIEEQ